MHLVEYVNPECDNLKVGLSIAFGATCDSFARMHSGTCLAGREAIGAFGFALGLVH
jgi:hypothetical protein